MLKTFITSLQQADHELKENTAALRSQNAILQAESIELKRIVALSNEQV